MNKETRVFTCDTIGHQRFTNRVLLAIILCIGIVAPSYSQDIHFVSGTSGFDEVLGVSNNCIYDEDPNTVEVACGTIEHAIQVAGYGDTIRLEDGPFIDCDLIINKNLTLQGIGSTQVVIDAGNGCRHFDISTSLAADVKLRNLNLIRGHEINGGSIRVGPLGSVTLFNTLVMDNSADVGGAIYNQGSITINGDSNLTDNSAIIGGAIWNVGTVVVNNSVISLNTASGTGGGINSSGGAVTLNNATLSMNTANVGGGAVNSTSTAVTITSSILALNSAPTQTGFGGAIANSEGSVLILSGSTVLANSAGGGGGGLSNNNATATIIGSAFNTNSSDSIGGGVSNGNRGNLTIRDSSFTSNSAADSGGALFDFQSSSNRTLATGSTFYLNSAPGGGAIHYSGVTGSELIVINSTFSANSSTILGAAIKSVGAGSVLMANATLVAHIVPQGGGAIFNDSSIPFGMNNSIISGTKDFSGNVSFDCAVPGGIRGHFNRSDNCGSLPAFNLGSVTDMDPVLGDNGGPTKTHRLFVSSNAIDQGFNACVDPQTNQPMLIDQRAISRPRDGDLDGNTICDIGAYEYVPLVAPPTVP